MTSIVKDRCTGNIACNTKKMFLHCHFVLSVNTKLIGTQCTAFIRPPLLPHASPPQWNKHCGFILVPMVASRLECPFPSVRH
jgi:hypothetical protein